MQLVGACETPISSIEHAFRKSGAMDRIWALIEIRSQFQAQRDIPLSYLLKSIRRFYCQDPRDKVYSALGMSDERTRALIRPDYGKTAAEVYAMAINADVDRRVYLHAPTLRKLPISGTEYPSWVTDFSTQGTTWSFGKYERDSLPYGKCFVTSDTFAADLKLLTVEGMLVDTVEFQYTGHRSKVHKDLRWQLVDMGSP